MTLTTRTDRRPTASLDQERPGTSSSHSPRLSVPPLERIVLDARSDSAPGSKPPVRIFVGTEPAQYRAERVFVWSIEQVRDPARVYEIHLMKELPGFRRRGWLTGFTNYRFAVPSLAGSQGRAIYNDVDQIYLADPAELFDTTLDGHGYLSVNDRDTSVMLIDCARMAAIWTLDAGRRRTRRRLETDARNGVGLWGELAPEWNVRDDETGQDHPKLLHFTTIHTQPWQPFPERYAYQHNPVADVWFALERAADRAGYHVFDARRPSAAFRPLRSCVHFVPLLQDSHETPQIEKLASETGSRSVLCSSIGMEPTEHGPDGSLTNRNGTFPTGQPTDRTADGVVCAGTLDFFPDEDVPWMLEELFRRARRFVYVSTGVSSRGATLPDRSLPEVRIRSAKWWRTHLDPIGFRYPRIRWHLDMGGRRKAWASTAPNRRLGYTGGNLGRPPVIWVFTSHKPGTNTQALGLAESLGWPYETKRLRFRGSTLWHKHIVGTHRSTRPGLDTARSDPLGPPWPDLIITAGWQPARVARWVQRRSRGRTQLVVLGRQGSRPIRPTDISVACGYYGFPPHPRRIQTVVPLTRVGPQRLRHAADQWRPSMQNAAHPWIATLVGGSTGRHRFGPEEAREMGDAIRVFAERLGGTVFASTSRRTGREETAALAAGLGSAHTVYAWRSDRQDNPYLGYLALADVLIVTGESESMLAEAAATDKPLYIYPLPERPNGVAGRSKAWLISRAQAKRKTRRGSVKPQGGLSRLCARLIERGVLQPRRDLHKLHEALVQRTGARFFSATDDHPEQPRPDLRPPLQELDSISEQVRRLLTFRVQP